MFRVWLTIGAIAFVSIIVCSSIAIEQKEKKKKDKK
jgi:hypothetical protein